MELASRRPDDQTPYTVKIRFIKEIPASDTQFLQVRVVVVVVVQVGVASDAVVNAFFLLNML